MLERVKRETGREIDLLGFDACLMNMLEVALSTPGTARFIVGSEELEPGDGWPYDRCSRTSRQRRPSRQPSWARPSWSATSLLSRAERDAVGFRSRAWMIARKPIDPLANALIKASKRPEYTAITKALKATLRFDMPDFVDLGHLCSELATRSKPPR